MTVEMQLRQEIADLHARYAACLDDGRYDEWPNFFTEDAWYRIVPRENYERDLPLSILSLKGRPMMLDRIHGATSTIFHAPYYQRHLLSLPVLTAKDGGKIESIANYTVIRTKRDMPAELFSVGYYYDLIVKQEAGLKFSQRFCVFDNDLIPNSLIYPI